MARTFHRKERLSALSEINVTPLIDLAFALLIIFMITTPLLEQSIPLDLPGESQKVQAAREETRFQAVSINAQGAYFWGELQVSESKLGELLEDLSAQADPPVLHLRADKTLPYQKVITLIDLIQRNNLTRLSLDTEVE